MGVYIKGMEMPKTKYDCPFWNADYICFANEEGIVCDTRENVCLPDNCPLVEVSESHERLIDANDVIERIKQRLGIRNIDYLLEAEKSIVMSINSSPTVIGAKK